MCKPLTNLVLLEGLLQDRKTFIHLITQWTPLCFQRLPSVTPKLCVHVAAFYFMDTYLLRLNNKNGLLFVFLNSVSNSYALLYSSYLHIVRVRLTAPKCNYQRRQRELTVAVAAISVNSNFPKYKTLIAN